MFLPAIIPLPGVPELILILVVVLIIFGPKKLPEIGKALGSTVRELRKSSQGEEQKDEAKVEAKAEKAEKEETPAS